jgi:hypothetical protein
MSWWKSFAGNVDIERDSALKRDSSKFNLKYQGQENSCP